jgi:hypothetical protein
MLINYPSLCDFRIAGIIKMTDSSDDEESIAILQKERNGRNKIGEIDLHELARSDDYQALKNAIAKVCC